MTTSQGFPRCDSTKVSVRIFLANARVEKRKLVSTPAIALAGARLSVYDPEGRAFGKKFCRCRKQPGTIGR